MPGDAPAERRRMVALAGVVAAALLMRVIAVATSTGNPSFATPITDAGTYDAVARHLWQTGEASPRLFWQPFLYPLQLAAVYAVSGGSILAAKLWQAVVGAATCGLVYLVGRRRLGHGAGLLAAGITTLYGPLILFEGELLATGAAAFWSAALLLVLAETEARPRAAWFAILGATGALAFLTRPTFLPFLVVAVLWLAVRQGRAASWRRTAAAAALTMVVFAALVAPFAVWNGRTTGAPSVTPGSGGLNVHLGNNPDACATLAIRPGVEWEEYMQRPARAGFTGPGARDRYFYGLVGDFVRDELGAFLAGLGRKGLQLVGSREIPRNLDVYLWGDWSGPLRLLTWKVGAFGFPFGVVFPLALVGLVHRGRRLGAPTLLLLVCYGAAVVAVFVTARYRVPLVPALALAAAGGVQALVDTARARRFRRLGGMAALAAAAVLLATLPGPFCEERQDMAADFWFCLGTAQFSDGRQDDAMASFRRALEEDPRQAQSHYNLGVIAAERGDARTAAGHYREAIRLQPDFPRARNNLAVLLIRMGDATGAVQQLREVLRYDPLYVDARRNLAGILIDVGRPDEALTLVEEAASQEPDDALDMLLRGKALLGTGRPTEATAALQRALAAGADPVEGGLNLGAAQLAGGQPAVALRHFEEVIAIAPALAWARTMAGVALAELGRHAAARTRFEEALGITPLDVNARFGLAKALLALGDAEGAAAEIERVLAQRPDHGPALRLRAELQGGG